MSTGKRFVLCKNCGYFTNEEHLYTKDSSSYYGYPIYLVGNYFIYEEGELSHTDYYYRINIANRQKYEIFKKEDQLTHVKR